MRSSPVPRRAGMTLIELLVVMPLLAVLLSGSAILLTAVFRFQGSLSRDVQEQSSRARLAVQWRSDAHAAMRVQCDTPQSCEFTLEGDETVRYEMKEARLHRELRRDDAVLERETYPLTGLQGEIWLDHSLDLPLIRLQLKSTSEPRKYAPVAPPSLLEAAVGIGRQRTSHEGPKP